MPKVKNCPRIMLPTPANTLPLPPPLVPSSIVLMKTVLSAPSTPSKPLCVPPPNKKSCPPPFIRGQVGRKFFSLAQPRNCTRIPDGCSLIIAGFRKVLPYEKVNSKYIILDPFGNAWSAPKVFDVWHEEVESHALSSDEFQSYRIAVVRDANDFFLAFSNRKTHINNVIHELQRDLDFSDNEASHKQIQRMSTKNKTQTSILMMKINLGKKYYGLNKII